MARKPLIWLCPEFTPYQETLFKTVSANPDFELSVEVMRDGFDTHPYVENDEKAYRWEVADPAKRVDDNVLRRVLAQPDAEVVVSSYLCPTLLAVMRALARRKRRFCFWSDVPLPRWIQWNGTTARRRSIVREFARQRLLKWIYRTAYRVFVMGTPGIMAATHLGCAPEKLINFPYWIPVTNGWAPHEPSPNRRHIVGLGQLIYRKGYDVAIGAFAKALAENSIPDDVRLILAGSGEMEEVLRKQVEEMRIADRVDFPGWLGPQGKRDLFSTAGAFIHPARWEPFGVVVLEAMERGIPILGSNATMAVLDRVEDGVSGYTHCVNDQDHLSRQIAKLYSSPQRHTAFGKSARRTAEAWRPERAIEILLTVWGSHEP